MKFTNLKEQTTAQKIKASLVFFLVLLPFFWCLGYTLGYTESLAKKGADKPLRDFIVWHIGSERAVDIGLADKYEENSQ